MQQSTDLQNMLHSIHRKSYPAYKSLKGAYQFGHYILSVDHVQGDPFASPSHISIHVSHKAAGFPEEYLQNPVTKITLSDFLTRQFEQQVRPLYLPCKRIWEKRSALCQSLWSGGSGAHCLSRSPTGISSLVSLSVFLPTDGPSMPQNWKRSCLIFSQSVYQKAFLL